jgi:AcrR family transcriptional regulator
MPSPKTAPENTVTEPEALFRRARPGDAVDLAVATFLAGERVDLQTLARRLDVSPATLHRWFGSRGALLDRVCGRVTEAFADAAVAEARGKGDERISSFARLLMVNASSAEPVRAFVTREPQLALKLILGKDGTVHRVLAERTLAVIGDARGTADAEALEQATHLIVQVSTALIWATFVIGEEPEIDSAIQIIRMVLESVPAG